jgi:hypothetical protein
MGGRILERIDSSEELPNMSSSADNLAMLRNSRSSGSIANVINNNNNNVQNRPRAKPVQPPRVRSGKLSDNSWAVDSSWEFIGTIFFFFSNFTKKGLNLYILNNFCFNIMTGNDDENENNRERDTDKDGNEHGFPSLEQQVTRLEDDEGSPGGPVITVQDIILKR